jgi:aquaporin NIP
MKNIKHRKEQYIAELIGTFFLVFFGCGAVVKAQLYPETVPGLLIALVFGGVVALMIYGVGHISGAHFNPAVTLSFWVIQKFPSKRVFGYILSQCLGGILACFALSLLFGNDHSFGVTSLSVSVGAGFFLEFLMSFILMFIITAVATDSRAVGELAGMAIGLTVFLDAAWGGPLTGASMNPARSIAPALLKGDFHHLWLYILAPISGAVLGAIVYNFIRCANDENEADSGCC